MEELEDNDSREVGREKPSLLTQQEEDAACLLFLHLYAGEEEEGRKQEVSITGLCCITLKPC